MVDAAAAAIVRGSIARNGRIENGHGAVVSDTAAMACSIA